MCPTNEPVEVPHPAIAVVLPRRETVGGPHSGAVSLTIAAFGHASAFRERLLVMGGARRGDFPLRYHDVGADERRLLGLPWPFWRPTGMRYGDAVARAIASHGCGLVEVHNRARLFGHLHRRLGARIPLCLHLHNDPQTMEGSRTVADRADILARAALVYCVSGYVRDRFVEGIGGPTERVVVLYNGIPVLPAIAGPRQNVILFVGRLIPEKGVGELFDALARIGRELPDWRAVIVGRPARHGRGRYARAIADLGSVWGERLVYHPSLSHAEVLRTCAGAAITVVPSRWQEPFGLVALEGLASGSAVIASRSGGLREVVGQAGLLLPDVTADAIAHAILELAHDPRRREALGRAGRERVAARFEIGLLARQLDGRRRTLLAEHDSPAIGAAAGRGSCSPVAHADRD